MQKQTIILEDNPKWRIYKGKFFCQIGPLSCDRARILYLIILWTNRSIVCVGVGEFGCVCWYCKILLVKGEPLGGKGFIITVNLRSMSVCRCELLLFSFSLVGSKFNQHFIHIYIIFFGRSLFVR